MGAKIKELVKENLSLSIDAQCLSIESDIQNQMDNRGVTENTFYRNSPVHANQGLAHPMSQNQMPMGNRVNVPTTSQNVVTLDTSTYPYANVVPHNLSPYPVQPGMPTLHYPMTGNPNHLSPHPETQRQMSLSPVHVQNPFYNYNRQGSVNILNRVPPPAQIHSPGGWMQPGAYPLSPPLNPGPPVPPRPNDLPLRNQHVRNLPTPHRPVPPPPTPPKPTRSPNLERPRSSNDIIEHRDDDENLVWECSHCTFQNHSAMNVCEMCSNSRVGSLGNIYSTFGTLYSSAPNSKKSPATKHKHHKSKKRSENSPHDRQSDL